MTLQEYINKQKMDLDSFEKFYTEGIKNQPDIFPVKLEIGDWDEQFAICVTSGEIQP